jgi:putative membrane protein
MDPETAPPIEAPPVDPNRIFAITRPDGALLVYYVVRTLLYSALVLFPIAIIPQLIRYYTLRYRFDEDGVVINWGWLSRSETIVLYTRIQDIHLTRTFLERWLGIGTVEIQTASSTVGAAESLVGLKEADIVRDYLYQRMRGNEPAPATAVPVAPGAQSDPREVSPREILGAIRDELRAARAAVEARP